MAPLILHNVPDDELYIGDDGIQRPYAMVFPHQDDHASSKRSRRAAAETGSFGKSSRRSRSKTATPRPREDPTIVAADKVFSSWIQKQQMVSSSSHDDSNSPQTNSNNMLQRRQSVAALNGQQQDDASSTAPAARFASTTQGPMEIILRGYKDALQQYAAIDRFEQVAGRICEDYPRDPPVENRRYKGELRDPAYTRRRALTPDERSKVNRADGGEHWVKVTFESAEAADRAVSSSPLSILGYLVYAEPYHGIPPTRDEPVFDASAAETTAYDNPFQAAAAGGRNGRRSHQRGASFGHRRAFSGVDYEGSPASSRTVDTATLDSETNTVASSATMFSSASLLGAFPRSNDALASDRPSQGQGQVQKQQQGQAATTTSSEFSRVIPTARKVKLLPADQALLPQPSWGQKVVSWIPFISWFTGSMIGNEVPRTETGEFDWNKASLYWQLICWLDLVFGLFGGEISHADKDE